MKEFTHPASLKALVSRNFSPGSSLVFWFISGLGLTKMVCADCCQEKRDEIITTVWRLLLCDRGSRKRALSTMGRMF